MCSVCSTGQLINGLCISEVVFPLSGEANSTLFSFDEYDFYLINEHATSELLYDSSTELLEFEALILEYPNATQFEVESAYSFKVPRYFVTGVTAFNASVYLKYAINGVSHTTYFSNLTLSQ